MIDVKGTCRILVRRNGKIVTQRNALDPTGSVNMLASFLGAGAHPGTLMTPDTLSLEDTSQDAIITTFTPPLANIPLDGSGLTDGTLTVTSTTLITYTVDATVPASVVFTVGIPAGYFPVGPQDVASISVNTGTPASPFSRVLFTTPIEVDDTTALTIEYTYTLIPAGV